MSLSLCFEGSTNRWGIYDYDYSQQPIVEFGDISQAKIEMYIIQKRLDFHREQAQPMYDTVYP